MPSRHSSSANKDRAEKWLRRLQRENLERDLRPAHSAYIETYGGSAIQDPEKWQQPFAWMDKGIRTFIVEPLQRFLLSDVLCRIKNIPVGTLFGHDPNAYAIRPDRDDCGSVVIIDWLLSTSLYRVVRPVVRLLRPVPPDEHSRLVGSIAEFIDFIRGESTTVSIPAQEPNDPLSAMAGVLERGSLTFILAHEYAHVILGHLNPHDVSPFKAGSAKFNKSWEQEFAADLHGLTLSRDRLNHLGEEAFRESLGRIATAGPLITMSVISLLEGHGNNQMISSTHPPAQKRWAGLATALRPHLTDEANTIASHFEEVFAEVKAKQSG